MPLVELPIDSGIDESVDRILLPQAKLRVANNCRLDRDGRIGVRPAYTAMATTTYSPSALVAYDAVNYNGRLCVLGDQTGQSRPTDLFEFVNAEAAWRATAGADDGFASGPRIPRATAVREVGRLPDLTADATEVWVAAGGGMICAVTQLSDSTCRFHVFNPTTDQTITVGTLPNQFSKCVFDGTKFWIIGRSTTSTNIEARSFNPATDESVSNIVTLVAAPGALVDMAVAQTGASDFTIAYIVSGALTTLKVNRFNSSGTSQAAYNVAPGFTSLQACAVAGNVAGTRIVVFVQDNGAFKVCSNTASGATLVGPTAVFGGLTVTAWSRIAITYSGSGTTYCLAGVTDSASNDDTSTQLLTNDTTNGLGTTVVYSDGFLDAAPAPITSGGHLNFYFGAHDTIAGGTGGQSFGTNCLIEQNTSLPQCFKDNQLTTVPTVGNHMCNVAILGTKLYWGNLTRGILDTRDSTGGPGAGIAQITEIEMGDTGRRSMVVLGNQLHIAGALPLVYDSRYLAEHGFPERPVITLNQGGTGGLKTLLGKYFVQTSWEVVDSKGYILRSQVSPPVSITLTGTNNAISVTTSTPHSFRRHPFWANQGGFSVRVGYYVSQAGGANFQIEKYIVASGLFAAPITTTLTAADTSLAGNLVVYIQSQTPVPHASPQPYQYSWRARERFATGGTPQPEKVIHSKLLFPTEPVEFAPSGRLGFTSRANQDVTALGAIDTTTVVFTAQEIGTITGRGPEQDGTGDFDALRTLNAPGGCSNWRSVVGIPEGDPAYGGAPGGLMFQMAADKIMLIAGSGAITWAGQPVRDTLAAYPNIAGAVHVRSQMIVAFACNNNAGSDGVIIVHDLRKDAWFVDTIGSPIASVSEFQGRLVYISGGVVFLQDTAVGLGAAALPTMQIDFGSLAPFTHLGTGDIPTVAALLTFIGDCSIQGLYSVDDGQNFQDMGSFVLGSANATIGNATNGGALVAGDPVSLHWRPNTQSFERLAVRFIVTAATNTGGIRMHVVELDVRASGSLNTQPASQTA